MSVDRYPARILQKNREVLNGKVNESEGFINPFAPSQDQNAHVKLKEILEFINKTVNGPGK